LEDSFCQVLQRRLLQKRDKPFIPKIQSLFLGFILFFDNTGMI